MRFQPPRFTGETYEADGKGEFRLRRRTVFERVPSSGASYRFRVAEDREEMPREEQERRDRRKHAGPEGTR